MAATDPEMLRRIATGDRVAFGAFYDRHSPRVFGMLMRLMRNRAEAEDVLQEVFLQVWTQAARFEAARASAAGWVLLLARSRGIERYRKEKRRSASPQDAESACSATEAQARLEAVDSSERVQAALAVLPEEQGSAIRLAFYGGLTHEEIAARQRIPLGTVKTRIRLGMRRLRKALDVHEDAA